MGFRTLTLSAPESGVAVLTLDRPARRNALTFEMFEELTAVQRAVDADGGIRALVLTGAGQGFCAGLDLDLAETLVDMPAADMLTGQESWAAAVTGFARMATPVVAAINGAAAGAGFSLALAADVRVAATDARFTAAFVRIGLSGGDCGSSYLLPRLVGLGRATEILLTGRFVDAAEALRIGLVTEVVEPDALLDRAVAVAASIAANSPVAMRLTKQVLATNVDAPSLDAALAVENRNQVLATRTADMAEALAAFRQRRPAAFVGR